MVSLVLFLLWNVLVPVTESYSPPSKSSSGCVNAANKLAAQSEDGNTGACISCDPTKSKCAVKCQSLIDDLYRSCDGVMMPEGLYYDPEGRIDGRWSQEVRDKVKIAVERCGCDASSSLSPSVLLTTVASILAVVFTVLNLGV